MITLTKKEAQQVLSELEGEIPFYSENDCSTPEWITDAIELLRARLAQPEPEPVAWTVGGLITDFSRDFSAYKTKTYTRPLYTAPPQAEPEPVAWMYEFGTDNADAVNEIRWYKNVHLTKPTGMVRNVAPLYTVSPKREFIGLTDGEAEQIIDAHWEDPSMFIEAIEAKLKEKNA